MHSYNKIIKWMIKTIKRGGIICWKQLKWKNPKLINNKSTSPNLKRLPFYNVSEFTSRLLLMWLKVSQDFGKVGAMKKYFIFHVAVSACKWNSSHASKLGFTPPILQCHLWRCSLTLKQNPAKVRSFFGSYYSVTT